MRLLALALVVEAFLILASQSDMSASDPLAYAENAYSIQDHPRAYFHDPPNHPFVMRLGLTVPLAGIYRVFGVGTLTTAALPLVGALAILVAVFVAVPPGRARAFALLFGVTAMPLVRYGSVLGVDVPCTALLAWSLLLLARRERGRHVLAGAMALWFAAFMVKESAIWCAPAWLYAVVGDARAAGWRATLRAYLPALAVGAVLAASYLWLCDLVWGNPLARFAGVQELANEHSWSLVGKPAGAWLRRLTWGPPLLLLTTFGIALLLAALAPRHLPRAARTWVAATLSIIALFWFGSASTASYDPLPLMQRMLLPALPGVVVLAAFAAERYVRRRAAIALVVAAATVPFAVAVVPHLFPARPETAAYAALRTDVARGPVVLVCADLRCPWITAYHFGFRRPPTLTVLEARAFANAPPPAGTRVRVLVNRARARYLETTYGEISPAIDAIAKLHLPILVGSPDVQLHDAGDGAALHAVLRSH
jgi:hypothetical protein